MSKYRCCIIFILPIRPLYLKIKYRYSNGGKGSKIVDNIPQMKFKQISVNLSLHLRKLSTYQLAFQ